MVNKKKSWTCKLIPFCVFFRVSNSNESYIINLVRPRRPWNYYKSNTHPIKSLCSNCTWFVQLDKMILVNPKSDIIHYHDTNIVISIFDFSLSSPYNYISLLYRFSSLVIVNKKRTDNKKEAKKIDC